MLYLLDIEANGACMLSCFVCVNYFDSGFFKRNVNFSLHGPFVEVNLTYYKRRYTLTTNLQNTNFIKISLLHFSLTVISVA
jgi:hypothetical protein